MMKLLLLIFGKLEIFIEFRDEVIGKIPLVVYSEILLPLLNNKFLSDSTYVLTCAVLTELG